MHTHGQSGGWCIDLLGVHESIPLFYTTPATNCKLKDLERTEEWDSIKMVEISDKNLKKALKAVAKKFKKKLEPESQPSDEEAVESETNSNSNEKTKKPTKKKIKSKK
jgi:hypothetical protein